MFFKQIWYNAVKTRKNSGLFFASLVIAIIAFYTLLSLGEQDVIRFLGKIESDAVKKLMNLLPAVYILSLFFVFFLVYFACKYQINNRLREFGIYLMLGMKRSRMFIMLLFETILNSFISLFIGIPISLLLTEGISLATAKIIGLGIIGHKFSFSLYAILWTVCGFIIIQLISLFVICIPLCKAEPADFLHSGAVKKQSLTSAPKSIIFFAAGIIMLCLAYYLGIFKLRSLSVLIFFIILISGITGTFFLYRGLGAFLGRYIKNKSYRREGISVFTARQVQENVLSQHKSLAVSSLLIMMALSCIAYGISIGAGRSINFRCTDFSVFDYNDKIETILKQENISDNIKASYPMYLSTIKNDHFDSEKNTLELNELRDSLKTLANSENILENLHIDYIISESSYNNMRSSIGKNKIDLDKTKVVLYTSLSDSRSFEDTLKKAVQNNISIGISGKKYSLIPDIYTDNIVADRAITLYIAMIVPDELYTALASDSTPFCQNLLLNDKTVNEHGLMQSIQIIEEVFNSYEIEYESYLSGIGRNLFYTVAASYLTIYLGVLFLLISNTVIGLKYLIQQNQTKHRYITMSMLGADRSILIRSVKKQISIFFLLVLLPAIINSAAAIISMFKNLTKLPSGTSHSAIITLCLLSAALFIIVEIIYTIVIKRKSEKEILALNINDRS